MQTRRASDVGSISRKGGAIGFSDICASGAVGAEPQLRGAVGGLPASGMVPPPRLSVWTGAPFVWRQQMAPLAGKPPSALL